MNAPAHSPTDLVGELRAESKAFDNHWMASEAALLRRAADEIERLQQEVKDSWNEGHRVGYDEGFQEGEESSGD